MSNKSKNEVTIFTNAEFGKVRALTINGEPWFVGKDVAASLGYSLGYSNTKDALAKRVDAEDKRGSQIATPSGVQTMTIINESGLYSLIMSSKLPGAKQFKRWVTSEVLPSIRKHGAYMTPETLEKMIMTPEFGIRLLTALKDEQEKRKALEDANAIMAPKADYYDALVEKNMLTSLRETAKEFKVGEKALIAWLLEHKYIYRAKSGKLLPYAKKEQQGLFETKEFCGETWSGVQTMVTPKGRKTLLSLVTELKQPKEEYDPNQISVFA